MKETTLRFGAADHLAGTITTSAQRGRLGLVLLSAGLLHRIGPHRLHVRLARDAAAQGVPAIRFDMPGIGDSFTAPGRASYEAQIVQATKDAMDILGRKTGTSQFVLAGLCSGADSGFHVAREDTRVVGLYLMEPPRLVSGSLSGTLRAMRRLREYGVRFTLERLWQLAAGGKLFRSGSDDARAIPPPAEYAAGLTLLAQRGVHLRLVYADSSMGRYDLAQHRARAFKELIASPTFSVDVVAHADHLFTQTAAKQELTRHLRLLLNDFGRADQIERVPAGT